MKLKKPLILSIEFLTTLEALVITLLIVFLIELNTLLIVLPKLLATPIILSQFLYNATPIAIALAIAPTTSPTGTNNAPTVTPNVVAITDSEANIDIALPTIINRGPKPANNPATTTIIFFSSVI